LLSWTAWNVETIRELIESHAYEPGWFDFKEVLTATKGDRGKYREGLQKTIAAMANGEGGFIIFGVADPAKLTSASGRDQLVGIELNSRLQQEFGNIANAIDPPVRFSIIPRPIPLDTDPQRGILVVRILRSPLRPHYAVGQFWRRGDGGQAAKMTYYEIRDQLLLSEERLRRVDTLRTLLEVFQFQLAAIDPNRLHLLADRLNVALLNNLMPEVIGLMPKQSNADHLLIEVAGFAAQVNMVLDWAQTNMTVNHWSNRAYSEASNLLTESIEQVLEDLDGIFGPKSRPTMPVNVLRE
jgi:hypothetical protein